MNNPRTSSLAITSLVLGCLSVLFGVLTGLPAVITGHIALGKIKRSAGTIGGRGLAVGGLVLGYIGICWTIAAVAILLAMLTQAVDPFVKTLF